MKYSKTIARQRCLAYIMAARAALRERRAYWLVPAGFWQGRAA